MFLSWRLWGTVWFLACLDCWQNSAPCCGTWDFRAVIWGPFLASRGARSPLFPVFSASNGEVSPSLASDISCLLFPTFHLSTALLHSFLFLKSHAITLDLSRLFMIISPYEESVTLITSTESLLSGKVTVTDLGGMRHVLKEHRSAYHIKN